MRSVGRTTADFSRTTADFTDVDLDEIGQQSTSITFEGNQITYDLLVPNGLLTNDHPHIFKDQSNDEQSKNGQKIFGQNKEEQAKQDQIKNLAVVTTTDALFTKECHEQTCCIRT